ncbi:FkbM family methyltransferase [Salinibacter ruber]|uniref:FkbM family methyltransferase n=1 Tax=Salinibacter ruber TaxID=146919 RepID=UPI002169C819|nr:FkbM family methyltransferase [Salinibacter ruber]MCS3708299.1 FkbM family methyltransferase [Salinibacter ruber]
MSLRLVAQSIWQNPGNWGKRIRKTVAAIRWQLRKRLVGDTKVLTLPNGAKFRAYPDCVVSSSLIYSNWPEYHALMFVRSVLRERDVVIDVGANVGHISLLLSDVVGSENLFAFEPAPVAYDRLRRNWRLNGWSSEHLFQVAIGAESGTVRFENPERPKPTASFTDDGGIEVPLRPLDHMRQEWAGTPVGFLKVDVEGYEQSVFRGADTILRDDRPRLIMFESLSDTLNRDIHQQLRSRAYVVFQLDKRGDPDLSGTENQNLFAVPKESREQIIDSMCS